MILDIIGHPGPLARLDPRSRILGAIFCSLFPFWAQGLTQLAGLWAASMVLVLLARVPLRHVARRLAAINTFMTVLVLVLPWGIPGETLLDVGGLAYSKEGLAQAVAIALKGNILLLVFTAFVSTMDPVTFAYALERLHVPPKLTMLLLFTLRYLTVLDQEYRRLRTAMTVRVFRPNLSRHTLRSLGYLVGMLLVRSLDRSERIHEAMKCRAFTGHFHTVRAFKAGYLDAVFATGLMAVAATLWWAV